MRDNCGVCGGSDACADCAGAFVLQGMTAAVCDDCGTCNVDQGDDCQQVSPAHPGAPPPPRARLVAQRLGGSGSGMRGALSPRHQVPEV